MNNDTIKLLEYKAAVDKLFEIRSPMFFPNGGPERARIVMRKLIEHAEDTISLVTHRLKTEHEHDGSNIQIWGWKPVLKAVTSFLSEGGKLRILMRDQDGFDETHPLYIILQQYQSLDEQQVVIKCLGNTLSDGSSTVNPYDLPSMIVSDAVAFRRETESEEGNFPAIAGAYAPNESARLLACFDKVFNDSNISNDIDIRSAPN